MTQSRQPAGNSQQRLVRWTFWLLLALVIGVTLSPIAYLPQQAFSLWDKAQHALAFAALAALGALAYPRRVGLLAASLLVFGGAIELAQAATGWRSSTVCNAWCGAGVSRFNGRSGRNTNCSACCCRALSNKRYCRLP